MGFISIISWVWHILCWKVCCKVGFYCRRCLLMDRGVFTIHKVFKKNRLPQPILSNDSTISSHLQIETQTYRPIPIVKVLGPSQSTVKSKCVLISSAVGGFCL